MQRRSFLKNLLGGIAAAAAAPTVLGILTIPESDAGYHRRRYAKTSLDNRDDLVGGWVSYKFKFTTTLSPTNNSRFRYIEVM